MSFATLALISLVAIVGPLLALPRRWHLPVSSNLTLSDSHPAARSPSAYV